MDSFTESLNQWGGNFLNFAWPMLWQSSLLITALFAVEFLFQRKLRASIRYALWLVVLVKLCVPPTLALPTSPVWWLHPTPPPVVAKPMLHYTVTYDSGLLPSIPQTPLPVFVPPKPVMNLSAWSLIFSVSISSALFLWLLVRWWQITRHVRRAGSSGRLTALVDEAQKIVGTKFKVEAKLTTNAMSPAVCGLFRPVILLPPSLAENFSDQQLRAVLLHELIHLRRRDVRVNFLQALLQIFYWWHPLVWLANARIRRVREEAVDDAVMLALRDEAEAYAPTLLEVAKLALNRPLVSLGLVGIMESRHALRQRIERLVDFHPPRHAGVTLVSLLGILAFTAVAVPMGEGPGPVEKPSAIATTAFEEQSLTVKVNPEIFIQNIKAQAAKFLRSPTNDYTFILLDVLGGEGVDCNPPHGLAFNPRTGEITTQNTPDKLEVFRQVMEQLNRADGKCELPLRNNFGRKSVLIEARIYQLTAFDERNFISGLPFYHGGQGSHDWLSVAPDKFNQLTGSMESYGLHPVQRPRIQTGSGMPADFFCGNGTNSVEFDCLPFVKDGYVDLTLQSTVVTGQPAGGAFTNQFNIKASAEDHGGIVVSVENFDGHAGSNLFVVIGIQILTNKSSLSPNGNFKSAQTASGGIQTQSDASGLVQDGKVLYEMGKLNEAEAKFNAALALEPGNATAEYYLVLIWSAHLDPKMSQVKSGRQNIIEKLNRIRLAKVSYGDNSMGQPLSEVLRDLAEKVKANDPDKKGINFLIYSNGVNTRIKLLDLTNVRLADVLDAIVLTADKPIKYSIQDFGIVFSARSTADDAELFTRIFKVNPNVLYSGLLHMEDTKSGLGEIANFSDTVSVAAQKLFLSLGVDLNSPPGKSVFYNDRTGILIVKATASDLDIIERALSALISITPQIHIKARFLEVPMGTVASFGSFLNLTNSTTTNQFTGILNATNAKMILNALESRDDVETLAEPEITTTSGRQVEIRATTILTVITNCAFEESLSNSAALPQNNYSISNNSSGSIVFQTEKVESGPILNVVPYVLSDGYTIYLALIPSFTEFLGYDTPTNTTATYDRAGEKIDVPKISPHFRIRQVVATVNLWDGQTVVLGGLPEATHFGSSAVFGKTNPIKKDLLVFVTAEIVDPAGNRVHSDDELPFAQKGAPPQPPQPK